MNPIKRYRRCARLLLNLTCDDASFIFGVIEFRKQKHAWIRYFIEKAR